MAGGAELYHSCGIRPADASYSELFVIDATSLYAIANLSGDFAFIDDQTFSDRAHLTHSGEARDSILSGTEFTAGTRLSFRSTANTPRLSLLTRTGASSSSYSPPHTYGPHEFDYLQLTQYPPNEVASSLGTLPDRLAS